MLRRLALAIATVAAATMLPAQAAPGTTTLYFTNAQQCGEPECYTLTKRKADSGERSAIAAGGTGSSGYTYSSEKKLAALKVDTSKPLTGTIWVQHRPLFNIDGTIPSLPGYVELDITVTMGSVTIGTVTAAGVMPPAGGLKVDVNLPIPASLKGAPVTKVSATVAWRTAVGFSGISHTAPHASFIVIPTR